MIRGSLCRNCLCTRAGEAPSASNAFVIPQPTNVNNATDSIRPTRLSVDFRVPTTKVGDARFYDFFGSNATTPRLRHAYGQVKNFVLGQTFSNLMDPDRFPDRLDFQGPKRHGQCGQLIAELRIIAPATCRRIA